MEFTAEIKKATSSIYEKVQKKIPEIEWATHAPYIYKINSGEEIEKPDIVILAAAKVGGIKANSLNQAEFLYQNLMIQSNVIKAAAKLNVEKLIFLPLF